MIFTFCRLAIKRVVCHAKCVVCRYSETEKATNQLNQPDKMKRTKHISKMETKKRLTASEKRFAYEMEVLMKMSLSELLLVEKTRMPIGV